MTFGPISSTPISASFGPAGPPGPPGPSGVLPSYDFAQQEIHCRWNAHYASTEINKKFLGIPLGVYFGFVPKKLNADNLRLITLDVDDTFGVSFARTRSLLDEQEVDVVFDQPFDLDFTGHDFGLNPTVYVKLKASVAVGQPTAAEVFSDALPPAPLTEQLLCVVTLPGPDPDELLVTSAEPTNKSSPYAWTTAPYGYGFMKDSAVEQLLAAVDMVNEVAAARLDLAGVTHPYNPPLNYGVDDRIGADLQPAAISSRLAVFFRVVRGNVYTAAVTSNIFDVSSSFYVNSRSFLPAATFAPGGSESQAGAITDGDVESRNVCFVATNAARERVIDSDRLVVYGRLTSTTTALTGTMTFNNGLAAIVGIGTLFTTELAVGALIVAPDGQIYAVNTITDNLNIALTVVYGGVTAPGATASRRVFTLTTYRVVGGAETPHSLSAGAVFSFYFPAWVSLSNTTFDNVNYMLASGEEPQLPNASTTVEGKVFLHPGTTGGLGGAVLSVKNLGAIVGTGNPVWGIDFTGAAQGAAGVADISAAGPTGTIGPPGGSPGPVGPVGPPGAGFTYSVAFDANPSLFVPPFGGWPSLTVLTHSATFPGPPKYIHGGLAQWQIPIFSDNNDHVDLTDVQVSGNTGTVQYTTPNTAIYGAPPIGEFRFFLNAAG